MKVPNICEGCINARYFKEGECWFYYPNKSRCVTREWSDKECILNRVED